MPPRWNREPDRNDPEYRQIDDRMTFATHVAVYAATNSGLWFFHNLQKADWNWIIPVTGIWGVILLAHALYIFAIANYSPVLDQSATGKNKGLGFTPTTQPKKTKSSSSVKK